MSSECDRATFDAVIRSGLVLTRAMSWQSEAGQARYVPGKFEVIDAGGKLYGVGLTEEAAIAAAYERIARPGVWHVLVGSNCLRKESAHHDVVP